MERRLLVLLLAVVAGLYTHWISRNELVHDFSGLPLKQPSKLLYITSEKEAIEILQHQNLLAIQGAGHSMNGLSVSSEVQIFNKNKDHIQWESDTILNVSSGFTVQEAEYFARTKNRHIKCLQDKGIFTIGGTHTVGGIGWESIQCGTQNHHVERVAVILPNGTKVIASESSNQEIFQFTLAGVGQTGYISSIALKTALYQKYHSIATFAFQTFEEAFSFLEREKIEEKAFSGEIDLFHGGKHKMFKNLFFWLGKKFSTKEEAQNWLPSTTIKPIRVTVNQDWIGHNISLSNVSAYHLWTDYVFPTTVNAKNFLRDALGSDALETPIANLHNNSSKIGFLAIYLLKPQSNVLPLSILGNTPNLSISIGFYHSFTSAQDEAYIKEAKIQQLELAVNNHGRPYNYGYNPLTQEQADKVYGKNIVQQFNDLRKLLDPHNRWIKSNYSALTQIL